MRAVLYAYDFEPITILELPPWAVAHLRQHQFVRLPVLVDIKPPIEHGPGDQITILPPNFHTVTIEAQPLARAGYAATGLMLFTRDEVSALLLKAAFLPGQQAALKHIRHEAFAQGFLDALFCLGR